MYKKARLLILPLIMVLICMIALCTSCNLEKSDKQEDVNQLALQENADASFDSITNDIFMTELTSNTLSLHYTLASPEALGITGNPITLGHCSESNRQEALKKYKQYINLLSSVSYDSLPSNDQLTYDILMWFLNNELSSESFAYYYEPLSATTGIQSQLPVLLSEYKFRTEQDIIDYLAIVNQVDSYFNEILTYETEKANTGLFMADYAVDDINAQCTSLIKDTSNHFLFSCFDSRIDSCNFLTDEKKADYKNQNKKAVTEHLFTAYQNLSNGLNGLKGKGTNQNGLCSFPAGKEYYSYLVKSSTGSEHSPEELRTIVDNQIQTDLSGMSVILNKNANVLDNLNAIKIEEQTPDKTIENLKSQISRAFPKLPDTTYEVKYIDSAMEKYLSPAFYLTPPIDCLTENVIYINQSSCPEGIQRFTTLAHEGYPGHLYQNNYTCRKCTDKIRSILNFGGYSEGYATYAENYSYDYLGLDQSVADILKLSSSVTLGLYASIDLGIHYEGWTITEVTAFLIKYGVQETETIKQIFRSIVEEPGNYLKYYIGYVEILQLKEKAETQMGNDFSDLEFHERFLTIGEAPFSIVEKYLLK